MTSVPGSPGPSEGDTPRDEQSETVGQPVRDDAPPRRTKQPVIWIGITVLALVVMAALLVYAAIRAA